MSTKHANPFREGSKLNRIFGFIKKKQVVTIQDVYDFAKEEGIEKADYLIRILLSPRKDSTRGADVRGNPAANGHLYFLDKLVRHKDKEGNKLPQKYRLLYRKEVLDKRLPKTPYVSVKKVRESVKAEKVETPVVETPVVETPVVETPIVETVETVETANTVE